MHSKSESLHLSYDVLLRILQANRPTTPLNAGPRSQHHAFRGRLVDAPRREPPASADATHEEMYRAFTRVE